MLWHPLEISIGVWVCTGGVFDIVKRNKVYLHKFADNLTQENNKRHDKTKQQPYVNHFEISSLRQRSGNALIQSVHDQH